MGSFWMHGARVTEREDAAAWERWFKSLYLLYHPDAPRVKVGVSGDTDKRFGSLRSAWGVEESKPPLLILPYHLWLFGAREARDVEQWILAAYKAHRLKGEWLALSPEVLELERLLEGVADMKDEDDCDTAMVPLARAIGWPMERFRFKRSATGVMLVESGVRYRGQSRQFRPWKSTLSRGESLKV